MLHIGSAVPKRIWPAAPCPEKKLLGAPWKDIRIAVSTFFVKYCGHQRPPGSLQQPPGAGGAHFGNRWYSTTRL